MPTFQMLGVQFGAKRLSRRKKKYSGKKKNHTLKNQLILTPNGQEIVNVIVEPGSTSDINIWIEGQSKLAATQKFKKDKSLASEQL